MAALAARSAQQPVSVEYNAIIRCVLFVLKLLTTLTLRYPAYLQAMQQEMLWAGAQGHTCIPAAQLARAD